MKGVRAISIFWPGGTWVGENTCALYNPQNDRKYYRKSTQEDSVSGELKKPIKRRTPVIMAHIAVCIANGGVLSKPHSPQMETSDAGRVLL